MDTRLQFRKVTKDSMSEILPFFIYEKGRSCDISYGGILMWADYFSYEYALHDGILYIMWRDSDGSPRFYRPLGPKSLREMTGPLESFCRQEGCELVFLPVPEYAVDDFREAGECEVVLREDLGDYLYDIETLATLRGKKMSKKRNHVNQFRNFYPDWHYEPLNKVTKESVLPEMAKIEEGSMMTPEAIRERELSYAYVSVFDDEMPHVHGGVLFNGEIPVAVTVGDVRGDTLFVQIEKASRGISGAAEMINQLFAADMLSRYPHLRYVNREEDAGDAGLRKAKESYHPLEILAKYSVKMF